MCIRDRCKGAGGGDCDPKTDPNQCKGNDDGKCDPKTDPNKCVKPSVEGEACDAELKCEGDVIQCAIPVSYTHLDVYKRQYVN